MPPCRYGWNCWRPGCVFTHRERQEHVRDLAEFWAEAARPLGIEKHRTTTEPEIAVSSGEAVGTAVAMLADEARPSGVENQSAKTEFDEAVSFGEAQQP